MKANLVSFHGPMLNSDFASAELPDFTTRSFLRTVLRGDAPGDISAGYDGKTSTLRAGVANGRLIGGNLSILCTLLGTPWQPIFRKRILFLEEVGESPYRIDRLLTHLLNAGVLQQVAGVAIGLCHECHDAQAARSREYRQTLEDVFRERLLPLGVPVVMGLPFGHVPMNATLPVGAQATLDATNGRLLVTEPAVS